mgnify:CR=1 FL=1
MIFRVGFKIFLMIFCISVPLVWIQYFSQRESLQLTLEMNEKIFPKEILDSSLKNLRLLSKLDPQHKDQYRKEFEMTLERKFAQTDIRLVQDRVIQNLLKDTLTNMAVVLGFFLLFCFFISRNLVVSFRKLADQVREQSLRLEQLNSIQAWQKIARVLVHELRAPITPIKLVATDMEQKYEILNASQFQSYLREGAQLICGQVQAVERLLESFTLFAKLPEVNRTQKSILEALRRFVTLYEGYSSGAVKLELVVGTIHQEYLWIDSEALMHLLFNLLKNAVEANRDRSLRVQITIDQDDRKNGRLHPQTRIRMINDGGRIPEEIVHRIFDLHMSTKKGHTQPNLGIGLTVARKIALDHQGHLSLKENLEGFVVFELELPPV